MKIYVLNEPFEVTKLEEYGQKVQIALTKDVVKEHDLLFLNNYPSLSNIEYQAVKVDYDEGLYYADLVKVVDDTLEEV
jgi:hypothetical protein